MGILSFKNKELNKTYLTVSVLGKSLKLNIKYTNQSFINLDKNSNEINLFLPKYYMNLDKTNVINKSIKRLYTEIAYNQIENSMEIARHILNFAPEDYKILELNDSFYKCKNNIITISPDIIQYSPEIINTTIIQAFCKSRYRVNSNIYKTTLQSGLLNYEKFKLTNTLKKSNSTNAQIA